MNEPQNPAYPSGVPQYAQQMTVAGTPMTYETMMELLAGADPATKEKLSRLSVVDDYAKFYEHMQRQAEEEARFNEMSEPQGKEVGGTYIAPNALQYLAQALRGIDSKKMGKAAMEGSLGNIGAKQGGLKSIMEMAEKQQQSLAALKAAQILRGNPGAEQEVAQRLREGMDPSLFGPGGAYEGY